MGVPQLRAYLHRKERAETLPGLQTSAGVFRAHCAELLTSRKANDIIYENYDLTIEYGLDRVSRDSIRNSVESRSGPATVTESKSA